jgi:hypothetical protein
MALIAKKLSSLKQLVTSAVAVLTISAPGKSGWPFARTPRDLYTYILLHTSAAAALNCRRAQKNSENTQETFALMEFSRTDMRKLFFNLGPANPKIYAPHFLYMTKHIQMKP